MWSIFTYLHPLPGFLPPKLNEKDCQNSLDLFLYEDSKSQCYLENNFTVKPVLSGHPRGML